jgi:hypothetical protein
LTFKTYQAYLATGVADLVTKTDALDTAVKAGNPALARTDWLAAHLTYETLGAAYSAFGDFDGQINGTTAGLPGGVDDPTPGPTSRRWPSSSRTTGALAGSATARSTSWPAR